MPTSQASYGLAPAGFRLPADAHPGRARLQVADLARSIGFYEGVLGMRVASRDGGRAELRAREGDRVLVELYERAGARRVPRRGTLGLYHFALLVPDRASLGVFVSHALASGAVTGTADHLVSEAIYLTDPDGLGIEVYADRPQHTWRVDSHRQLAMASDPLDIDDLVEAAAGRSWTGPPGGTVMGHVHLHVGSLTIAEAFYHQALGFDKVVWTYPGALFLSAGGYHHHLGTNTWSSGAPAAEDQARLLSWDLHVGSTDAAAAAADSVRSAGYAVTQSGDSWTTADPFGTTLVLTP